MRVVEGVQVLLSTPMSDDWALDYGSTQTLIEHVIRGGVHGIILAGSSGEFFALSEGERKEFTERAIRMIAGRVAVGVCVGTPGTDTTIELARHGERCGADYVLVPIPFYFSNTVAGIVDFYARVAHSVSIPVMPYDGGGGYSIDMETWGRIVEANPNISLAKITVPLPPKVKRIHDEFAGRVQAFGGNDRTCLLCLANGAAGLTVVGANVVPEMFARMFELYRRGDRNEARRIFYEKISPMTAIAMPAHTEFIQCYKQALYWMGAIASPCARRPMMPLDEPRKEELLAALIRMGVPLVRDRCVEISKAGPLFEAQ